MQKFYQNILNLFQNLKIFLKNTNYDELLNIDGIGETQINSIKNFFSNKTNLKVLNELRKNFKYSKCY